MIIFLINTIATAIGFTDGQKSKCIQYNYVGRTEAANSKTDEALTGFILVFD